MGHIRTVCIHDRYVERIFSSPHGLNALREGVSQLMALQQGAADQFHVVPDKGKTVVDLGFARGAQRNGPGIDLQGARRVLDLVEPGHVIARLVGDQRTDRAFTGADLGQRSREGGLYLMPQHEGTGFKHPFVPRGGQWGAIIGFGEVGCHDMQFRAVHRQRTAQIFDAVFPRDICVVSVHNPNRHLVGGLAGSKLGAAERRDNGMPAFQLAVHKSPFLTDQLHTVVGLFSGARPNDETALSAVDHAGSNQHCIQDQHDRNSDQGASRNQ